MEEFLVLYDLCCNGKLYQYEKDSAIYSIVFMI